jgi:D-alanyl-D-alanine carboxypeptidase (penicillin-binding protein 5/6)
MKFKKAVAFLLVIVIILSICPVVMAENDLKLDCEGAILIEAQTGKILYESNPHKKWYPASMTKIMTLILAFEAVQDGKVSLDDQVTASEYACSFGGTQVWLEPGEKFSLKEMLIAIAVGSANDCSVAVAEHIAGSETAFARMMTERAKELGAQNTNFVNSHGLHDDNHYTTPYDLAQMARHAVTLPQLLEMTSMKEYLFREEPELLLYNTNKLLWWFEGTKGLKTGTTDAAKRNLTAAVERDGLMLISVVMGAEGNRGHFTQSMSLQQYGFARYGYKEFYERGQEIGEVKIGKGVKESVKIIPKDRVGTIIPKGEDEGLEVQIELPEYVEAPVEKEQEIGNAVIFRDGKKLQSIPLVAVEQVGKGSLLVMLKKVFVSVVSLY